MMRSFAIPINMAPEAETMASTWNSAPVDALPAQVAVRHQRGEQHGDGDQHGDQDAEAVHDDRLGHVVCAPCSCTSDHCHRATPRAPPEITTVPIVLTRTRSGLRTSEARPRSDDGAPDHDDGRQDGAATRIGGMVMVFDAAWLAARSGCDHFVPSTPLTATDGW